LTASRPERIQFPAGFQFGAATSAYQIEGSPLADGAGPSIWHRFVHSPGTTTDGATGDIACDHYRRFGDDVALMRAIGLAAYRFSLSWSRILPAGRGTVNRAGLDFYSRLVDLLLENGIQPFATLYHWDLPAALDDRGGWLNPDVVDWFADYARIVFRALGDRVSKWMTINEPWVVVDAGYLHGVHAPGHRNLFEAPIATHHLLLAHGTAVKAFRSEAKGDIGIAINLEPKTPATDSPEDVAATARADAYMNRQYMDALFFGRYPEEMAEIFGAAWPRFPAEDFATIAAPCDFLAVNYYTRALTSHEDDFPPVCARRVTRPESIVMETGWEVHPESLTRILLWVRERYGTIPVYVTENGAAFYDPPSPVRGRIEDPLRVEYLRSHLHAAHAAIAAGVDLRGYFVWSLLDNLEWASGFARRFGIVHVDFATQERTLKASGEFYREVIRTGGDAVSE
jgi:beta-glucosidase